MAAHPVRLLLFTPQCAAPAQAQAQAQAAVLPAALPATAPDAPPLVPALVPAPAQQQQQQQQQRSAQTAQNKAIYCERARHQQQTLRTPRGPQLRYLCSSGGTPTETPKQPPGSGNIPGGGSGLAGGEAAKMARLLFTCRHHDNTLRVTNLDPGTSARREKAQRRCHLSRPVVGSRAVVAGDGQHGLQCTSVRLGPTPPAKLAASSSSVGHRNPAGLGISWRVMPRPAPAKDASSRACLPTFSMDTTTA